MTRKPNLNIDTGKLFLKDSLFRHTISGSIDFLQKSWKVGATGLKERSPMPGPTGDDKIHPFHQLVIQPSDIKILKELGSGGSSTVHLISYRDSQFALKIINMDDEKHQFKSAQSEIETLRNLQSKYVVNMRQAFIRNRRIAIILEYMNASSLDNAYQKCNSLTQTTSLARRSSEQVRGISNMEVLSSITSHILLCMIDMKQNNICHRDIKPSNILLHAYTDKDGVAKITDFGLAKILSENEVCTEIVGTYKYHSPERLLYHNYDISSDIWSLGLTVAESFLGRYPFTQKLETCTEDEMRKFLCGDPLNDSTFPRHLFPDDLYHFISTCLKQDPLQRLQADQLLQHPFLRYAKSEENSRQVIGKWIEQKKLELPKTSQPVQIRSSTPKGQQASIAHQFFSVSLDQSPVVSMSLGSSLGMSSSILSNQFQQMSVDDGISISGSYTNFGYEDPCIDDSLPQHHSDYIFSRSPTNYDNDIPGFHTDDTDHFLPKDEMEVFGFSFEGHE